MDIMDVNPPHVTRNQEGAESLEDVYQIPEHGLFNPKGGLTHFVGYTDCEVSVLSMAHTVPRDIRMSSSLRYGRIQ
jgi:hypothetical protein